MIADPAGPAAPAKLLIAACGSPAVLLLPNYLAAIAGSLRCRTTVIMTHTATRFITAEAVALFADEVVVERDGSLAANHVSLAARQDLIVVLPATAHMLAAAAGGQAGNIAAATVLAASCPVLFAPSMNRVMWTKPAVQRNVRQLEEDGYEVIEPEWSERFEPATRSMARNPAPPTPRRLTLLLAERLGPAATGLASRDGAAGSPNAAGFGAGPVRKGR